jgi:hypothetical protein
LPVNTCNFPESPLRSFRVFVGSRPRHGHFIVA